MSDVVCHGNLMGEQSPDMCYFYFRGKCCFSVSTVFWFLAHPCGFGEKGKWHKRCIGGKS